MNMEMIKQHPEGDAVRPVRPPKAVIFDMDGTLVDSMPAWHDDGLRYLAKLGIQGDPALGDILFTMNSITGAQYLIDTYQLGLTQEEVSAGLSREMEDYYFHEASWKPGALELLEALSRAGVPMGIVTSTDLYCVEAAMDLLNGRRFFQFLYCASDIGLSKTEPEIFLRAARALGEDPADTWVVEDGLYAVDVANAAGFTTVGVYDRISEKDQADLRARSDLYVERLTDLSRAAFVVHEEI